MKRWLIGAMAVMMAVSLAACTPTTEKQRKAAEATRVTESLPPPSTGGATDKVPDPNVMPVAVVSIYHGGDSNGLVQDMDSLDTEGLDAQLMVDKLIEYGVLTDGTQVISFDIEGKDEDAVGTLDLNQAESAEGASDKMFLTELGNTFTENFELSRLKLKVNGANYEGDQIKQGDSDYLTYNTDYENVE